MSAEDLSDFEDDEYNDRLVLVACSVDSFIGARSFTGSVMTLVEPKSGGIETPGLTQQRGEWFGQSPHWPEKVPFVRTKNLPHASTHPAIRTDLVISANQR